MGEDSQDVALPAHELVYRADYRPLREQLAEAPFQATDMHFLDTGLAAYLTGWTSPQALEAGAMSGQVFEAHAFGEIYKSFLNAGQRAPLYFFRNNDKKEIDLLMKRDGMLFPIEVKKTASPSRKDAHNLNVLDSVNAPDVIPELSAYKRGIGTGAIVCMVQDTFPVSERAWAFPAWAI